MNVPKKRVSRKKRNTRISQWFLKVKKLKIKRNHFACSILTNLF
jgi:ribosomal protein L32